MGTTSMCLLALLASVVAYDVELKTKFGKIGGFKYTTTSNTISDIVLNIPYAQPPVGELRFEKPRFPLAWNETRNGTDFGFQCVPHAQVAILPPAIFKNVSENCLTMNVMRPSTEPPAEGWPILVWIHGGGYKIGSQTLYGFKGLANIFNPKGLMVVSIQYRIGIFGFLSTGDEQLPGNYGLFDQALALKFINENAAGWGGNPSSITLLGQSAGAASAAQLSISPYSRQYVKGTISASGSLSAPWARGKEVPTSSKQVMEALGCPTSNKAGKDCMKTKTIAEIFAAVNRTDFRSLKFGPRVDGDFFPKDPIVMIRENPPPPAIIGVCNRDASYFTYLGYSRYIQPYAIPVENWANYTQDSLIELMKEHITPELFGSRAKAALERVKSEYLEKNFRDSYDYFLVQSSELNGAMKFYVPAFDEAQARMDAGSDVYLYRFDHYNDALYQKYDNYNANLTTQVMKGAPHTNEYIYWFEMTAMTKYDTTTPEETIVKQTLQEAVANFAKNRVPTNPYATWTKANKNDMNFLKIDKNPQMLNDFYREEANFWHNMRAYGYDLASDQPSVAFSTAPPTEFYSVDYGDVQL